MTHRISCLLILCLLGPVGCATIDKLDPTSDGDVADKRDAREASLVSEFEKTRSEAQYAAALSSWQHGDSETAREILETMVAREPENGEARRLLADLLLEMGEPQLAENHLRLLISQNDVDDAAHYALGLLLENSGRESEALSHLQRAVELDPENELFGMTADALGESLEAAGYAATIGGLPTGSQAAPVAPAGYSSPAGP